MREPSDDPAELFGVPSLELLVRWIQTGRTTITRDRAREIQRLEKLLEDAGIKLSSVASDITGVSGRSMLPALIAGERDPAQLADLAKRRMRSKIPELTEALTGRFGEHHAFLARSHPWHGRSCLAPRIRDVPAKQSMDGGSLVQVRWHRRRR